MIEQLGRAVAPGPFVPTVIASAVLAACGGTPAKDHVPGLADGSTIGAVALASAATVVVKDGKASGHGRQRARRRHGEHHPRRERRRRCGGRRRRGRQDRDGRGTPQHGSDAAHRPRESRERTRHRAAWRAAGARRSRPRGAVGGGRGPRSRVHGDGRRVLEGAPAVRSPDRDVPSGEASLRQHGGGDRAGDERSVGCSQGREHRRRSALICRRGRRHARRPRRQSVRESQHAGARWHRDHVGARRPSVHAAADRVARLSRPRGRRDRLTDLARRGVTRAKTVELPPEAEAIRDEVRTFAESIKGASRRATNAPRSSSPGT